MACIQVKHIRLGKAVKDAALVHEHRLGPDVRDPDDKDLPRGLLRYRRAPE